ncbi:MAG: hypothetical protein ACMUIM_07305 [bacterium]
MRLEKGDPDMGFDKQMMHSQRAYFEILEGHFGQAFRQMRGSKSDPDQAAAHMAQRPDFINEWEKTKEVFLEDIQAFWDSNAEMVYTRIREMKSLKLLFSGDISPSSSSNIAGSLGLYVDTIVLPDPMLRIGILFNLMPVSQQIRYLLRHVLNMMSYRDLALADVAPPILVIAPDPNVLESNNQLFLSSMAESDALFHFERLFERSFPTKRSLDTFLESISTPEELVDELRRPDLLLFDVHWEEPLEAQIRRYQKGARKRFNIRISEEGFAKRIYPVALGRMLQVNDAIFKSMKYQATPFMNDPTLWQYLIWKYSYDAERLGQPEDEGHAWVMPVTLRVNGEMSLRLITGMPEDILIRMRKQDTMTDFRTVLREALHEIREADLSSVKETTRQAIVRIEKAFTTQEDFIHGIMSRNKQLFHGKIFPWVIPYKVSMTAAFERNVPLTMFNASQGLKDLPAGKDLWKKGKALLKGAGALKRLPPALIFKQVQEI